MADQEQVRKEKLDQLKEEGINPYPSHCQRTHSVEEVRKNFASLSKKKAEVTLVGRLKLVRLHGKSCFADLEDGSGRLQIYFQEDVLGPKNYQDFTAHIDLGDFLQVEGELFSTKRGEQTLRVKDWRLLAKALLPLPEKWHGLEDVETRFRKRHLDLIANQEVRQTFITRSKMTQLVRDFFNQRGFLEVYTPILQPLPGGAAARPFVTHHHALDMDLYLRIAPELYLKRLIIGGLERVYEVAPCFRNEGIDRAHNPEFTQVEFYQAYADYKDLMKITEDLLKFIFQGLNKNLIFEYQGKKIDFTPPYPRLDFRQAILKETGIDLDKEKTLTALKKQVKKLGLEVDPRWGRGKLIDELYKEKVRPNIFSPIFLFNHPLELSPLAKKLADRPAYVERMQLVAAGMEVCNGFTELNDPLEQEERFRAQQELREKGDEEAQQFDHDFIEALKQGMPPTAGEGIGLDRLALLLTDQANIREVLLFPTLKPKPNTFEKSAG